MYQDLAYRAPQPGSHEYRPREIATKKHERPSGNEIVALLKAAAAGNQRAWDALVREFDGIIKAIARAHRLSHADVQDVSQATWLKLLKHVDNLREPDRVGGWLATTARRESLRVLRASERYVLLAPEDAPDREAGDPLPDDLLLARERHHSLWHSLGRLRSTDQALLRLLTTDPCPSYGEIAAALDMPIGSIGPTRARALERLRAQLASDGSLTLLTPEADIGRHVECNTSAPRVPVLTADRNGAPPLGRVSVARRRRRRPYPARHVAPPCDSPHPSSQTRPPKRGKAGMLTGVPGLRPLQGDHV
jgi:RNA polymerase sigma factor (sigma-70 family)